MATLARPRRDTRLRRMEVDDPSRECIPGWYAGAEPSLLLPPNRGRLPVEAGFPSKPEGLPFAPGPEVGNACNGDWVDPLTDGTVSSDAGFAGVGTLVGPAGGDVGGFGRSLTEVRGLASEGCRDMPKLGSRPPMPRKGEGTGWGEWAGDTCGLFPVLALSAADESGDGGDERGM